MDFIDSVVDLFVGNATFDIPAQKKKETKTEKIDLCTDRCLVACNVIFIP